VESVEEPASMKVATNNPMMKTQSVISDQDIENDFDDFINKKAAIPQT